MRRLVGVAASMPAGPNGFGGQAAPFLAIKRCTKCQHEKSISEFRVKDKKPISRCRSCERSRVYHTSLWPTRAPTYRSWKGMFQRCTNPKTESFKYYGARGITVCARWLIYENFFSDMGPRPPNHSIDRIDVNGNYEPGNCRWATAKQQSKNKRKRDGIRQQMLKALHLAYEEIHHPGAARSVGKDIDAIISAAISRASKIRDQHNAQVSRRTVKRRLGAGWSIDRAISEPDRRGAK